MYIYNRYLLTYSLRPGDWPKSCLAASGKEATISSGQAVSKDPLVSRGAASGK